MRTQVAAQIRGELAACAAVREGELEKRREELVRQQQELAKARDEMTEQVRLQVEQSRKDLQAEANRRAQATYAFELADRDERLKELSGSLAAAQQQELELRKMQRQLQAEKDMLKLEAQRQLDAQRSQLIAEVKAQFDQEHQLKLAERDRTISEMSLKLRELQRKIEHAAGQQQSLWLSLCDTG